MQVCGTHPEKSWSLDGEMGIVGTMPKADFETLHEITQFTPLAKATAHSCTTLFFSFLLSLSLSLTLLLSYSLSLSLSYSLTLLTYSLSSLSLSLSYSLSYSVKSCTDLSPLHLCTLASVVPQTCRAQLITLPTHSRWLKSCLKIELHFTW